MCLEFREQSDMVAENPQLILVVSIKLTQLRCFLFLNVDLKLFPALWCNGYRYLHIFCPGRRMLSHQRVPLARRRRQTSVIQLHSLVWSYPLSSAANPTSPKLSTPCLHERRLRVQLGSQSTNWGKSITGFVASFL
jgi:hypothetical protein